MFKKILLLILFSLTLLAFDKSFPSGKIMGTASCPVCHMSISKYYKTSHAVVYTDGSEAHFCSMSCLSNIMKKRDDIKMIYAVDAVSGKLMNAKTAIYVIGSDVPSTMGEKKSRLAFETQGSAEAFQKEHGGTLGNFEAALTAN